MSPADFADLTRELILATYPHLRGALRVEMTRADVLYTARKGSAGTLVEIGWAALNSPRRHEILARAGCAAQEIHSGLTSAVRVTAHDEAHL